MRKKTKKKITALIEEERYSSCSVSTELSPAIVAVACARLLDDFADSMDLANRSQSRVYVIFMGDEQHSQRCWLRGQ